MSGILKDLLESSIFEGCGDSDNQSSEKCRTQINLTQLHSLLSTIIDNQTAFQIGINDIDERVQNLEQALRDLEEKPESRKSTSSIKSSENLESRKSSITEKPVLPPLKSRSSLINRTSSLELAKETVANFASKNEIDKLNTRLDLFQTKLDKITNIVPSNENLLDTNLLDSEDGKNTLKKSSSGTVNDTWSKMVLTKRIESNEESLDKFTQMIDELSNKLKQLQAEMSKKMKILANEIENSSPDGNLTDSINDVLNRLAQIESGTSKIDDIQKKLNSLAKLQKEVKTQIENTPNFSSEIRKLQEVVESLENQFKNVLKQMSGIQQSVSIAQQQAASALAGASGQTVEIPTTPIQTGPDLETIQALENLKLKLNNLVNKVDNIEEKQNTPRNEFISQNELELMKASLLEEIPNYIENSLENIRNQLSALVDKNDKLNEIIDVKLKRNDENSVTQPTRPRSGVSRTEIDKLASKAQVEKIQETLGKSTKKLDDRITSEIVSLHEKIQNSSGNLWNDVELLKSQFGGFTEDLGNLRQSVIQKISEVENSVAGGETLNSNNSLLSVDTLSPALTKLIDRLQKKQHELSENLSEISGILANLDEQGRGRSEDIKLLFDKLRELDDRKADKKDIERLHEIKADKSEIVEKISRDDFDLAMNDMNEQMNGLIGKMLEVEENWKTSLEQTNDKLRNSMNSNEMNEFKSNLEGRLKNLKTLLERNQQINESYEHGDSTDNAAIFRKPLLGYKCVTCDKVTYPVPGAPVASIPVSGNLPHMRTIRPFTTFDLHTIRSQSKITKTGYEERMMLKMKQSIDKKYREHVASTLNSAFNVHEQHKIHSQSIESSTVPIGGGSSIPKGYQISKTGRSCGGGHTLTNPHVRFTHLKNLGEMWEEVEVRGTQTGDKSEEIIEQPTDDIKEKVEESCQETQLMGNDGHIYRGRQQD